MSASRPYFTDMPRQAPVTADELLQVRLPDKSTELVRGVLVVREKPGFRHGAVTWRLAKRIGDHVDAHGLGAVLAADTGFKIASDPDTVRAPDIAFLSRDRIPDQEPRGFMQFAPDLAVETLSPDGDRPGEVLAKVGDYLEAGARLVWVVDPERLVVRVYRADGTESLLGEHETLDGEDVLPGFTCPLGAIW